ncbi:MAG: IS66 family transposase, partial [Planctomycetia bacterium]|nr:IS66 family transposase [Planctomycetia bacterium]
MVQAFHSAQEPPTRRGQLTPSPGLSWNLYHDARRLRPIHSIARRSIDVWRVRGADRAEVLLSRVIHTDDTPLPVLDPTLPHTRTGRLWVYCGDRDHPYAVYDYTASRKRDGPAAFLKNFTGYLQADAFGGYDGIYAGSGGKIVEVACWAHARRKFHEAQRTAGRLAHEALVRIGQLYTIERELREACAGAWNDLARDEQDTRIAQVRQERARPLLALFRAWLDAQAAQALPKSPIGQAIS